MLPEVAFKERQAPNDSKPSPMPGPWHACDMARKATIAVDASSQASTRIIIYRIYWRGLAAASWWDVTAPRPSCHSRWRRFVG